MITGRGGRGWPPLGGSGWGSSAHVGERGDGAGAGGGGRGSMVAPHRGEMGVVVENELDFNV